MKRTKLYIRDSLLAFVCGQVERYEDEANVGVDAAHGTGLRQRPEPLLFGRREN
jgi:hypothetical protein